MSGHRAGNRGYSIRQAGNVRYRRLLEMQGDEQSTEQVLG